MDVCIFCQVLEDTSHALGHQGGFLEASSSELSKAGQKEEFLAKLHSDEGLVKLFSTPNPELVTEVNNVSNSSVSCSSLDDDNASFGSFEKHMLGIGKNLLTKMGYKEGGLGINGQGITQPLEVVERPRFAGL